MVVAGWSSFEFNDQLKLKLGLINTYLQSARVSTSLIVLIMKLKYLWNSWYTVVLMVMLVLMLCLNNDNPVLIGCQEDSKWLPRADADINTKV